MFNEDELTVYDKTFQTIGVLDKEEQKKILEFFYTLGVILNSATHIVRNKFKILSNNILPSILPCQKIHLT